MKLKTSIIVVLMISLSILSAGTIQKTFTFSDPVFAETDGYHKVTIDELTYITKPGEPQLPSLPVQMLLPAGEKAIEVEIDYSSSEILSGSYNIYPSQRQYPMNYDGDIEFEQANPAIYNLNKFFPENLTSEFTTQYMRGHSIALLNLFPIQYNPQTGEVRFYNELTVTIRSQNDYEAQTAFNNFFRTDNSTQKKISYLVSNSEELSQYPANDNSRDVNDFEYIVITPNQFLVDLNSFISFKESQGYHVYTKTTEDIYAEYSGTDIADQIRNFIVDAYQTMGAEFVLLVGDTQLLPHRGFWVDAGGTVDYGIPSELYYEGLDRVGTGTGPDWNVDGDGQWAETSEADFFTEVHVGRLSVENSVELAAAINKQMMYQDQPVADQLENVLTVGEQLNDNPVTWGGTYKDEIITGGSFNGYTTVGMPANLNIQTLYERDGYWNATDLANHMNSGLNILNHLGHSNVDYNMKFYNTSVTNQTLTANGIDNNFFLIYSQGCLPAAIEQNCIAEKFTTIENGCAAFVGNSRYGWYSPGGTNSGSQYMDRQFFNALFDTDVSAISSLNAVSKEVGASQAYSDAWFRWSYYCLLVLGDPTLDIWTAQPTDPVVTYQPSIPMGATAIPFQTDVPYARIGLMQNDELIGRAIADEYGDVLLETFEPVLSPEEITVSIIGHNKNRHSGSMVVISNEPYVIFDSYDINDSAGNNNGEPDYNESISLDVTLNNLGNQPAADVTAVISTDDDYITITDDTENFGDFATNQLITIDDAFSMDIAELIPDQHVVEFTVEATGSADETWTSTFNMILNAPEIAAESMFLNDSNGNNNGILDPGETATIIINTENVGHAVSPDAMAGLVSNNPLVTLTNSVSMLGPINAQGSANATYEVTADASIEIGTLVEFNFAVFAGVYILEKTFTHQVGLIAENFETASFNSFPWEFTGHEDWTISDGAYEGTYCAMSGQIGHNQNSGLRLEIDVVAQGDLSFYRTVSSEANYDYLKFYVDGTLIEEWSGDVAWEQEVISLDPGNHILEWKYVKDQGVAGGTDCARIDYIIFPPLGVIFPPMININPNLITTEIPVNTIQNEIMEVSNIGGEVLNYSISTTNSPDWLSYDPETGSLGAGEVDEITLIFDSYGLTAGSYNSALLVDDGIGNQHIVPVTMTVTATGTGNDLIPLTTELYGNHPNPFNPTTEINFGLNVDSKVALNIYNIKGQKVKTLINNVQEAGYHTVQWNGRDDENKQVTSGVYFYEFRVYETDYTSIKKMILLK